MQRIALAQVVGEMKVGRLTALAAVAPAVLAGLTRTEATFYEAEVDERGKVRAFVWTSRVDWPSLRVVRADSPYA